MNFGRFLNVYFPDLSTVVLMVQYMTTRFILNGNEVSVDVLPDTPLLYVLRNDFGINGSRFGCGLGQCGACSVLLDGVSIRSCIVPVDQVRDRQVTTLEGLGNRDDPHILQQAFIEEQAMQCGYCSGGIMISAAALLAVNPDPDDVAIRRALAGHICRCGTHTRIIKAVKHAARMKKEKPA